MFALQDVEKRMKKVEEEHLTINRKLEAKELDLDLLRSDIATLQKQIKELQ